MNRWEDIIQKIKVSAKNKNLAQTNRLFFEAIEIASKEGMMGDVNLRFRNDPNRSFDANETLEEMSSAAIFVEKSGYTSEAEDFLRQLIQFGDDAIYEKKTHYKVIKKSVMLQIEAGAYHSALIFVDSALKLSAEMSNIFEELAMLNNYAAIYAHLSNLPMAENYYLKAIDHYNRIFDQGFRNLIKELDQNKLHNQINEVIKNNLKGLSTGYDPDFIFLKDNP